MAEPIRVLLVDDQVLFRSALAKVIDEQDDMVAVGEAENGLDGVEKAHALRPDVVVMDVEMPAMGGVAATRLIKEQLPGVKVVVLTVSEADDHVFDAIRVGADGYLLKNLRPAQLFDLLRSVMRNETPLSPVVAGRLVTEFRGESRLSRVATVKADEGPHITRRELEILRLVADGLSNKEIAARAFISEGTVKNHIHNALRKLQLDNRIQAAAYVVRNGLGRAQAK